MQREFRLKVILRKKGSPLTTEFFPFFTDGQDADSKVGNRTSVGEWQKVIAALVVEQDQIHRIQK